MIIVIIATAASGADAFGPFSFVVLFLYPVIGTFFLSSLLIQFARFAGHSSEEIAVVVAALVAYLAASIVAFERSD